MVGILSLTVLTTSLSSAHELPSYCDGLFEKDQVHCLRQLQKNLLRVIELIVKRHPNVAIKNTVSLYKPLKSKLIRALIYAQRHFGIRVDDFLAHPSNINPFVDLELLESQNDFAPLPQAMNLGSFYDPDSGPDKAKAVELLAAVGGVSLIDLDGKLAYSGSTSSIGKPGGNADNIKIKQMHYEQRIDRLLASLKRQMELRRELKVAETSQNAQPVPQSTFSQLDKFRNRDIDVASVLLLERNLPGEIGVANRIDQQDARLGSESAFKCAEDHTICKTKRLETIGCSIALFFCWGKDVIPLAGD